MDQGEQVSSGGQPALAGHGQRQHWKPRAYGQSTGLKCHLLYEGYEAEAQEKQQQQQQQQPQG